MHVCVTTVYSDIIVLLPCLQEGGGILYFLCYFHYIIVYRVMLVLTLFIFLIAYTDMLVLLPCLQGRGLF